MNFLKRKFRSKNRSASAKSIKIVVDPLTGEAAHSQDFVSLNRSLKKKEEEEKQLAEYRAFCSGEDVIEYSVVNDYTASIAIVEMFEQQGGIERGPVTEEAG